MIKYDNIKYFDEPIYKYLSELRQGDVIYTEFGDYGNYIQAIFNDFERTKPDEVMFLFHYPNGKSDKMYEIPRILNRTQYKIIGKEIRK